MLAIQNRPLGDLRPDPRNARRHDVAMIADSIRRFGFRSVLVVTPDGGILAGHGRVKALQALRAAGHDPPAGIGLGWAVPCLVAPPESRADALAYLVADNRAAEHTTWDRDALAEILVELAEHGGLAGTGYDVASVEQLAADVDAARAAVEAEAAADADPDDREPPEPRGQAIAITFADPARYARVLELLAAAPGTTYAEKIETALDAVVNQSA